MIRNSEIAFVERDIIPDNHPVARFITLWQGLPRLGRFPDWKAFNPMSVPQILPWLILLEIDKRDGEDVHLVRVQGSACVQMMDISFQGKYIQDVMHPIALAERREEFGRLDGAGGFVLSKAHIPIEGREFQSVLRGTFVFSSKDKEFSRIVLIIAPEEIRLT